MVDVVVVSVIGGWILLLLFTFAVTQDADRQLDHNPYGAGSSVGIFADGAGHMAGFKT